MVKGTVICNLPDWVPVPTNGSTISIINLVVAVSNVPFGIFAFLSNLAIIVTVVKTPSLQRPSNILLCSLATSDCLVGLVAQPLFVTWWMHIQRVEDYSCLYLQQLTLAALIARMFPTGLSLANLTVVSLDRCYALCRPFAYRAKVTKRGAIKVAVFTTLAWITTIVLINILPRIPTLILLTKSVVIFTILPTANYIIMFMAVRHQNRKVQDMVSSQQLRGILRREKKVTMNMFIVSVVLAVCVIPKLAVILLSKSSLGSHYNSFSLWSTTLFLLNSSINPILYTWRDPRLRAAVRSVINI